MRLLISLSVLLVLLSVVFYIGGAASIEIPPEVQKKAVLLKKAHADAERSFSAQCGKCHKAPDPAKQGSVKQDCSGGFSKDELILLQGYIADVKAGKGIYESYCDRCHALIEPGAHNFDYWSRNICSSDSCLVKKKLSGDEEQQLLLYLSAHSKKN